MNAACEEEALFAVEDTSEGVVVSTFHPPTDPAQLQGSQRLTLQGHRLSEECGHTFTRCQHLLRETFLANGVQQTVVFVPLVDGLAVVGLSRGPDAHYRIQLHTILQTIGPPAEISCSPSAVYKILDSYFAVCTNQTTNYVSVLEVQLNTSSLPSSRVTYPSSQLTVPPFVGNITNASNFVHVEIDRNHEYIIFAVGTVIYSMRPFLYAAGPLGNGIPGATCERVNALVHKQGAVLYAFCTDHLFTYDIGEEDWLVQDTYARRGLPYRCPAQETDLNVFTDYIQYTMDGLIENLEIQGDAYSSGVCFGNATQHYFAFRDKSTGVFVLNLQTSELVSVSVSACQDSCYPLNTVDGRYLIVREDALRKVLVLDYLGQRLRLIEALHTSATLATVVQLDCPVEDTVTTGSTGAAPITESATGVATGSPSEPAHATESVNGNAMGSTELITESADGDVASAETSTSPADHSTLAAAGSTPTTRGRPTRATTRAATTSARMAVTRDSSKKVVVLATVISVVVLLVVVAPVGGFVTILLGIYISRKTSSSK